MKPNNYAWESFLETGKIDDYLEYCQARKQDMYASSAASALNDKGAQSKSAIDNQWHRPAGPQNR